MNDTHTTTTAFDEMVLAPSDEALSEVVGLAKRQILFERNIAHLEEELEFRKKELLELTTKTIPEAMQKLGLTEITFKHPFEKDEITKLSLKKFYSGTLALDKNLNALAGLQWLRDNGYESLIKTQVKCDFGRDAQDKAVMVSKALKKMGVPHTMKDDVHYQTLCSWIKEMMEHGKQFPQKLFNTFCGTRSEIKTK